MNSHSYNIGMKINKSDIEIIREMEHLLDICSDETRLKIMYSLLDEGECTCKCGEHGGCANCKCLSCMIEKCVSDIVFDTNCSQSLISHQLKVLKDNELVKARKDGLKVFYTLKDGHIKALLNIVKEHVQEK